MSSAKTLQNKIFGASASSSANLKQSPSDPGLTINIPKQPLATPNVSHTQHKPGPTTPKDRERAGDEETVPKKYRERVAAELKSEYESTERHRLLQDERKERHWKRWGPYLAERQWVRFLSLLEIPVSLLYLGHGSRGLFVQRRRLVTFSSFTG